MPPSPNSVADSSVISLLETCNPFGWELLYDKYAPVIYGFILNIITDKDMANEVFEECFISLKKTDIFTQAKKSLPLYLLQHTYSFTVYYLKNKSIVPVQAITGRIRR